MESPRSKFTQPTGRFLRADSERSAERAIQDDHKYPFVTMVHLNRYDINPSPIRMAIKRPSEFANPRNLNLKKEVISKVQ